MSRRVELPDEHRVRQARDALLAEATASDTRPSVIALARRLGLTNTTFWRHYPQIAREVADARNAPALSTDPGDTGREPQPAGTHSPSVKDKLATLRRENQALHEHLELAAATIARLTLDNNELREALESAQAVTSIHARAHRRPPGGQPEE